MSIPETTPRQRSAAELDAYVDELRASPREVGTVDLVVRRPGLGEREVLTEGVLDPSEGLVGDDWCRRTSTRTPDGSPHPDMQLNVMNHRMVAFLAVDRDRRALAGDQLYVDLDLSEANLPPGSRLRLGDRDDGAVIEVTAQPHRGCAKFLERYGEPALRFVNSRVGRELRLRGLNARVVTGGRVRAGDPVRVIRRPD